MSARQFCHTARLPVTRLLAPRHWDSVRTQFKLRRCPVDVSVSSEANCINKIYPNIAHVGITCVTLNPWIITVTHRKISNQKYLQSRISSHFLFIIIILDEGKIYLLWNDYSRVFHGHSTRISIHFISISKQSNILHLKSFLQLEKISLIDWLLITEYQTIQSKMK